jgi:hypothetical protein
MLPWLGCCACRLTRCLLAWQRQSATYQPPPMMPMRSMEGQTLVANALYLEAAETCSNSSIPAGGATAAASSSQNWQVRPCVLAPPARSMTRSCGAAVVLTADACVDARCCWCELCSCCCGRLESAVAGVDPLLCSKVSILPQLWAQSGLKNVAAAASATSAQSESD